MWKHFPHRVYDFVKPNGIVRSQYRIDERTGVRSTLHNISRKIEVHCGEF